MIALGFAVPPWWPVLVLVPLVGWALWRRQRACRRQGRRLLGRGAPEFAGRSGWRRLRLGLAIAFGALVTVSLLRPVGGLERGEPVGADVALCVDVSWSMAAQDLAPGRLQRAAAEIAALAERARGTRVALVVFAGEARLLVPLTTDVAAVAVMAAQLVPGAELRGGTDLGAAIDLASAALQRSGAGHGSIVLMTDGEDFGGAGRVAAGRARAAGQRVDCIGFGTATGSKIAVEADGGQGFLRDARGEEVISALDLGALRAVAAAGGGVYASAEAAGALAALHDGRLLPRARAAAGARGDRVLAQRYQWPLLAAVLLWMLRLVIRERAR